MTLGQACDFDDVRQYTAVLNFGEAPVMNHDRKLLAAELRDRVEEKFEPVV